MNQQDQEKLLAFVTSKIDAWLPGAMFPSELSWLLESVVDQGCTAVVECGRQDGVSTELLGRYLTPRKIKLYSIDFDDNADRARQSRERVKDLMVECVSGDIHAQAPQLLNRLKGKRVCIVQDGPKGWEGLTTILAASQLEQVVLIAQHNLHLGHKSRELFQFLDPRPAFVDESARKDVYASLRTLEMKEFEKKTPNRQLDHTSLGVMPINTFQREKLAHSFDLMKGSYGLWNPKTVYEAWKKGDFDILTRLKARRRYTFARFQKR